MLKVIKNMLWASNLKKYEIINNPFQLENYLKEKINNKLIYKNGEINILFISIPSKEKGLLESIKLISKVFKNDNWTLNVIGWSKKNFIEVYFNEQI